MANEAVLINSEATNRALRRKAAKAKAGKIVANAFIYFVLLLMYLPIIYITVFSFSGSEVPGEWTGFTFANYGLLFDLDEVNSRMIWEAARNTALVAVTAAAISTILGTLGAIGIHYLRRKWKKNTLDFITQIPVVNAEVVTAIALVALYAFISTYIVKIPFSFITLVIGHVVISIPYVVLSVGPKLEQMDPSLYEAAMDLGATQTQALWKVIVPDILPGILSGFLLSITLSLDDYVVTVFNRPKNNGTFHTISTFVDSITRRSALPTQLRAFTAILFVVILIVMIVMNVKSHHESRVILKKEKNKND